MMHVTIEKLIDLVSTYNKEAVPKILSAYEYALKVHGNQRRKSGELYIVHPLCVSYIQAMRRADGDAICAALLHDTIEDGEFITKETIAKFFGEPVATIVDGVTKMDLKLFPNKEAQNNANTRKVLMGAKTDLRIILLKLADRLHNMLTLKYLSPEKQIQNSLETLEIYVPIAEYIGAHQDYIMLAELAFQYLNDNLYKAIEEQRQIIITEDDSHMKYLVDTIHHKLNINQISNQVNYRFKTVYAIFKQISQKKISPANLINFPKESLNLSAINSIHDMRSLKVLVKNLADCYTTQDLIKEDLSIITIKDKDCIKNPKTNGYQALHSTIIDSNKKIIQTQIRTEQMDRVANLGLASLWYDFGNDAPQKMAEKLRTNYPFFQTLLELDDIFDSDKEFVQHVKKEVLSTLIYPRTPQGKVIELPRGATPVDFAYKTCTTIGYNNIIAVVNGNLVPLDYPLTSKDTVEIIPNSTSVQVGTLSSYAVTTGAKRRIRSREGRV